MTVLALGAARPALDPTAFIAPGAVVGRSKVLAGSMIGEVGALGGQRVELLGRQILALGVAVTGGDVVAVTHVRAPIHNAAPTTAANIAIRWSS